MSEKGTIVLTVASPNDVLSILPQFTYCRKKVAKKKRRRGKEESKKKMEERKTKYREIYNFIIPHISSIDFSAASATDLCNPPSHRRHEDSRPYQVGTEGYGHHTSGSA